MSTPNPDAGVEQPLGLGDMEVTAEIARGRDYEQRVTIRSGGERVEFGIDEGVARPVGGVPPDWAIRAVETLGAVYEPRRRRV